MHNILLRGCRFFLVVLAMGAVVACSTLRSAGDDVANKATKLVKPYKIEIVQGNVVTREQLTALRPGMPRATVQDILGAPLLASVFHADRWDYVFTLKRPDADMQSRHVTVFFKNEVLDRVDADELPSEAEFVATLKSTPIKGPLPAMSASEEALDKFPAPTAKDPVATATAPTPAASAPTAYPPLEPASAP